MTQSETAAAADLRLHPLSILFSIGSELRNIAIPALVTLFAARRSDTPLFLQLIVVLLVALAASLVRYFTFRIRYADSEMVIRSGLLRKNERHIPYSRIQSIDSARNAFHQLFGVAEVVIQTAGGDEPEAKLSVLPASAIHEIRGRVFGVAGGGAPQTSTSVAAPASAAVQSPQEVVLRLGTRDLMAYGFIENRGMFLVFAAVGLLFEFGPLQGMLERAVNEEFGETGPVRGFFASAFSRGGLPPDILVYAGIAVLGLLILVRLISVIWAAVRMYDFTVTRNGDDLRVEYGLFTRIAGTIPITRVQGFTVRESLAHRMLGRATVSVSTAGGIRGGVRNVSEPLIPVLPVGQVDDLIERLWPGLRADNVEWRPLHPRAHLRIFRGTAIDALIYTLLLAVIFRWWALLFFGAMLLWNAATLRKRTDSRRWGVTGTHFLVRGGWLSRYIGVAWLSKVQVLETDESYFDRRTGMATLTVDTSGTAPTVRFLPREIAESVRDDLTLRAAQSRFRL